MLKQKLPMILMAVMLVSFTAAVVITGAYLKTESVSAISMENAAQYDPVLQFRTDREQLRAMEKAQLNDIIHASDTEDEIRNAAQRQLMELCSSEEKELTVEGILSVRGFADPVATVHGDSVNVIIAKQQLTRQESAVIMELVCRECGVDSGNVKIIPVAPAENMANKAF